MGQGQSAGTQSGPAVLKTSYYVLLGVDRTASEDELKKAYRRKALELHPDRNYGREADATAEFADIQAAYDVLSDVHERAWYDAHEGDILRGVDPSAEKEPHQDAGERHAYGVRLTTTTDLNAFLAAFQARRGASAGSVDGGAMPPAFYSELSELFARLADEEVAAARAESDGLPPDYPAFGTEDSPYETHVRGFYSAWTGFATKKTFFWADRYRVADAEDRRMRRAIEKENKKLRDEAVRQFNDAVRAVVGFVRRRDPRYVPNRASAEERQKMLRDVARQQAERSRKENAKKGGGEVPEWAKGGDPADVDEWGEESEGEDEEEVVFECVVCDKTFKSEGQVQAHERSKKHQTELRKLRWEMRLEDDALALGGEGGEPDEAETADGKDGLAEAVSQVSLAGDDGSASGDEPGGGSDDDASSTPPDAVEATAGLGPGEDTAAPHAAAASPQPKVGKAAQKRARKAAAATSQQTNSEGAFKCAQCNAAFPSRTQLFQHIGDFGHAALKPAAAGKGKKKGKR